MTDSKPETYEANVTPPASQACVELLDAVLDLAVKGKVISVGIVIVSEPGKFRIAAAGKELGGLMAGAAKMQDELAKVIEKEAKPRKPKLTIIHNQ